MHNCSWPPKASRPIKTAAAAVAAAVAERIRGGGADPARAPRAALRGAAPLHRQRRVPRQSVRGRTPLRLPTQEQFAVYGLPLLVSFSGGIFDISNGVKGTVPSVIT